MRRRDRFDRLLRVMDMLCVLLLIGIFVACLVMLVTSCAPAPAKATRIWPAGAPTAAAQNTTWFYCFAGQLDDAHSDEGGLICLDTEESCRRARGLALKWGGLEGIAEVGECVSTEIAP